MSNYGDYVFIVYFLLWEHHHLWAKSARFGEFYINIKHSIDDFESVRMSLHVYVPIFKCQNCTVAVIKNNHNYH